MRSEVIADPSQGLAKCLDLVPTDSWVLVTGSLYLVGAVRRQLLESVPGLRVSPARAALD